MSYRYGIATIEVIMTDLHTPQDEELSSVEADFKEWQRAFRRHRKLVQQGIRDRLPKAAREATLTQAMQAVPDLETDDEANLEIVAGLLEAKLGEMVAIIRGEAPVRLVHKWQRRGIDIEELPHDLLEGYWGNERRWLFTCGMREILHEYRDRGTHVLLSDGRSLLKRLIKGVEQISSVIAELNSHPMVEHCLNDVQHDEIARAIEKIREAHNHYNSVLNTGSDGLTGVMENNEYRIRNQFTVAATMLSLGIYGHITTEALERLLVLKSLTFLDRRFGEITPQVVSESEHTRNVRNRERAVRALAASANRSKWPIRPVLQLYRNDPRLGLRSAAEAHL